VVINDDDDDDDMSSGSGNAIVCLFVCLFVLEHNVSIMVGSLFP